MREKGAAAPQVRTGLHACAEADPVIYGKNQRAAAAAEGREGRSILLRSKRPSPPTQSGSFLEIFQLRPEAADLLFQLDDHLGASTGRSGRGKAVGGGGGGGSAGDFGGRFSPIMTGGKEVREEEGPPPSAPLP